MILLRIFEEISQRKLRGFIKNILFLKIFKIVVSVIVLQILGYHLEMFERGFLKKDF